VRLAVAAALLALSSAGVSAAPAPKYPTKPVRIVVPYAAGGPLDEGARLIAQKLTTRWRQPVLVDARGGSGGALGAELVTKAPADGYTLLLGNSGPITVYPHLRKKRQYDPERDLEPVTFMLSSPMLLIVHPSTPVKSVRDLVRIAKSNPKGLTYASAGVGNLQHLSMELLQITAGVRMVHVPYKGAAPAFVDLLTGQVDLMFANILGALPQVRAGRMRAIAVSSANGSPAAADVPSIARDYPDFDITTWQGIFVPAGTPRELIELINRDIVWALTLPETKQRFNEQGAQIVAEGPGQLGAFVKRESALFAKIIRTARIPQE